jgi:hypothetical protein
MSSPACRYFDSCSAPLCPEDPDSLQSCAWFPDEESCHRGDLKGLAWLRRQRKIARVTGGDPARGCFTFAMLYRDCRISKAIKGVDPDRGPPGHLEGEWLTAHPEITAEARAKSKAQGEKIGALYYRPGGPGARNTTVREDSPARTLSQQGGGAQ